MEASLVSCEAAGRLGGFLMQQISRSDAVGTTVSARQRVVEPLTAPGTVYDSSGGDGGAGGCSKQDGGSTFVLAADGADVSMHGDGRMGDVGFFLLRGDSGGWTESELTRMGRVRVDGGGAGLFGMEPRRV